MPLETEQTIYPCPLSKHYSLPSKQAWLLLKIYFLYRFVLACLLIILFYGSLGGETIGSLNAALYKATSFGYLFFILTTAPFLFWRIFSYTTQAQSVIFSDILIVTLIMHACGGVNSGLGVLLAIPIAASGLLIGGRCCLFLAAIACFAVFSEQLYFIQEYNQSYSSLSSAGLLGASFFTIAILSLLMAQRTEQSERLANQHQQTILRLEELNRYIIQHLQSGVIISDPAQRIILSNEASLRFFQQQAPLQTIQQIHPALAHALAQWLQGHDEGVISLKPADDIHIQARFSNLHLHGEDLCLIMLEDMALYNQRLQHNKLASLGRLTASIAHEIRNPLGAISHAGQLLSEEANLSAENKRLTEIIQNHSLRVNHIIEDILKLSRRTPSQKQHIRLDSWLPDFISNFCSENEIDTQRITFSTAETGLTALIDGGHLRQILTNLCSNAIHYGPPQSSVLIELLQRNKHPCINIIDQGEGLDCKTRQHLFEPFFTTSSQGTGLGLYISRELAELNQAKLSYDLAHKHTCFSLYLANADLGAIDL